MRLWWRWRAFLKYIWHWKQTTARLYSGASFPSLMWLSYSVDDCFLNYWVYDCYNISQIFLHEWSGWLLLTKECPNTGQIYNYSVRHHKIQRLTFIDKKKSIQNYLIDIVMPLNQWSKTYYSAQWYVYISWYSENKLFFFALHCHLKIPNSIRIA